MTSPLDIDWCFDWPQTKHFVNRKGYLLKFQSQRTQVHNHEPLMAPSQQVEFMIKNDDGWHQESQGKSHYHLSVMVYFHGLDNHQGAPFPSFRGEQHVHGKEYVPGKQNYRNRIRMAL